MGGTQRTGGVARVLTSWSLRLLTLALVVGLWFVLTELEVWDPLILPRPASVWDAFVQSVTTDGRRRGLGGYFLWEHLEASLWRILNGVFWAIVLGVAVGFALSSSSVVRTMVEPLVSFLRSLPPLAYFTILIFWFGIEDTSKIWLLFLAAFPPVTLATMSGIERVSADRIDAARSLGGSRAQVIRHVVLPSALPDIFTGVRVATGFALTTIVAAETVNGLPGIGGLAWVTEEGHAHRHRDPLRHRHRPRGRTARPADPAVRTGARALEGPRLTGRPLPASTIPHHHPPANTDVNDMRSTTRTRLLAAASPSPPCSPSGVRQRRRRRRRRTDGLPATDGQRPTPAADDPASTEPGTRPPVARTPADVEAPDTIRSPTSRCPTAT